MDFAHQGDAQVGKLFGQPPFESFDGDTQHTLLPFCVVGLDEFEKTDRRVVAESLVKDR